MNKKRALLATIALASGGLVAGNAGPAHAGCGVSITVDNDTSGDITVDWDKSDVRTSVMVLGSRVAAPWARLGTIETDIDEGDDHTKAFTLALSCNIDRQYRIWVIEEDGSTHFEYFPGPGTGTWTRDLTPWVNAN
jgi:hypothetical protein